MSMNSDVAALLAEQEAAEAIAEEMLEREKSRLSEFHEQLHARSHECECLLKRREELREALTTSSAISSKEWDAMQRTAAEVQSLDPMQEELRRDSAETVDAAVGLRDSLEETFAALAELNVEARKLVGEMGTRHREQQEIEESVDQLERHVKMQARENQRLISERQAFEAILRRTSAEVSRAAQQRESMTAMEKELAKELEKNQGLEMACNDTQARIDGLERAMQLLCAAVLEPTSVLKTEMARLESKLRDSTQGSVPHEMILKGLGFGDLVDPKRINNVSLVDHLEDGDAAAVQDAPTPDPARELKECLASCAQKLVDLEKQNAEALLEEQHKTAQAFRDFQAELLGESEK
ncbi:Hypothetical Protein FCC1311_011862 [Hondaea fermentalgiana]|uniref:Uncharacterized protein n=1 Tax=Hondaea fermentalgiana TaxID=2315210 RepID=A0A2R5G3R7_9STRA|nr:Hypothetical Protein FCC1311_011862 [Hondaea fermentalgiana]|eukprot:GBG24969.1 Hypothetical Protein FCC1311_011862 [Hondaea fermentalgiana]